MIFYLHPSLARNLGKQIEKSFHEYNKNPHAPLLASLFDYLITLKGELYREQKGRRTERILLKNQAYYLKKHLGISVKEIIKNLLSLRLPIMNANNEWRAINACKKLGLLVPQVYAYGTRGIWPHRIQSFVLMKELKDTISLETFTQDWQNNRPSIALKRQLIKKVANIAKCLHENGINHRDFYLCHFLVSLPVNQTSSLYTIDWHRAQLRKATPLRWKIKDLAGLYFSSKTIGLTKRDLYLFVKVYSASNRANLSRQFWRKVIDRGEKLYHDENR